MSTFPKDPNLSTVTSATPVDPTWGNSVIDNINALADAIRTNLWYYVKAYDVSPDGDTYTTGNINSGSTTLSALSSAFVATCTAGMYVRVSGAGAGSTDLVTSIASVASTTSLTLTDSASTTVVGATVEHDETTNMGTAATAASGGVLILPKGTYLIKDDLSIGSDVTLWFMPGAKLSIGNGKTVTISGKIVDTLSQIFSGQGSVAGEPDIPFVRPEWWGAVQDGSTDSASAIQAALDFACSSKVGEVRFLPGDYVVQTALTLTTKQEFSLVGTYSAGPDTPATGTRLVFTDILTTVHGLTLDNCTGFKIQGIKFVASGTTLAKSGLCLSGATGITYSGIVDSCDFRSFTDAGIYVNGGSGVFYIQFRNCISKSNNYGFYETGAANSLWFQGGRFFSNTTAGMFWRAAQNITIDGVDFEGQPTGIQATAGYTKKGWYIRNCYFEGAMTSYLMRLGQLYKSVIGPCYIATGTSSEELYLESWCQNVTVLNWPGDITIGDGSAAGTVGAHTENIVIVECAGTVTDNTGKIGAVNVLHDGDAYLGSLMVLDRSSLDTTVVNNGTFETDPTVEWTSAYASLTSVTGGQSGNCLKITNAGGGLGQARQTVTVVPGRVYKIIIYQKSDSTGAKIQIDSTGYKTDSGDYVDEDNANNASWTQYTYYVKATASSMYINLLTNVTTASETTLFDEVSVQEVNAGNMSVQGDVGIGTHSPATKAHVQKRDATNGAVVDVLRLDHTTTGTAADGIGTGLVFFSDNDAGETEEVASIDAVNTDVTDGSENSEMRFGLRGSDIMKVNESGVLTLGSDTLTLEADATLDQDYTTDADVEFGGLTVSGGSYDTSNMVTNGAFTVDTSDWTAYQSTLTIDASGQSGNCLKITLSASSGSARQVVTVETGRTYQFKFYHKNGSVSLAKVKLDSTGYKLYGETGDLYDSPEINDASWTQYTATFTALTDYVYITLLPAGGSTDYCFFDTIELYKKIATATVYGKLTGDVRRKGIEGHNVVAYGADATGASDSSTAFTNAIAAGDSVIVPAGTFKISSDTTVTSGTEIEFLPGAMLSIDTGITFTIAGTLKAGLYQIFSGDGTASLAEGSVEYVIPQWWGAVGDDSTDSTTAIQAALDTGIERVFLPEGTYKITSALTVTDSGLQLFGADWQSTQIKAYGGVNAIEISNHNVRIEDLRVFADTAGSGSGIKISDAFKTYIHHVWIGATGSTHYFDKGIELSGSAYYTTAAKCAMRYNTYNVYMSDGGGSYGPNDSHLLDCTMIYGDYGVYIADGNDIRITLCGVENYNTRGVYVAADRPYIINNRFETSAGSIQPIELATGVSRAYIAKNTVDYCGDYYVLDNSGSDYNYIEDYQMLFSAPGLSGTESSTQGGNITLSIDSSSNIATDLKMEATLGDLQLEASASGQKIELQSDTDLTADSRLELYSPLLLTPVGGFGERAENRVKYSEDFTNAAWASPNVTVTADQATAPNGRDTADKLVNTTAYGTVTQTLNNGNTIASGTKIRFWCWARAVSGTLEYFRLRIYGASGNSFTNFAITPTWTRCEVSYTAAATEVHQVDIYPNANVVSSEAYVWGAQVVYGTDDTVVPYIKTLDAVIAADKPALIGADLIQARRAATAIAALTYAATIAANMDNAGIFTLTTTGNCTINASNGVAGQQVSFIIADDATGGHVVTFGTNFKASGTLTGTASKSATVDFVYDGTNWYEVSRTTGL